MIDKQAVEAMTQMLALITNLPAGDDARTALPL